MQISPQQIVQQIMYNQICPWKADSQNFIHDDHILIFSEPVPIQPKNTLEDSQKKIMKKKKRPATSCSVRNNNNNKIQTRKSARPLTSLVTEKVIIKQEPQMDIKSLRYSSSSSHRYKFIPFQKKAICQINFEGLSQKKGLKNTTTLFTGYNNFNKCKVKKCDRPCSILTKNSKQISFKPQLKSSQISGNKKKPEGFIFCKKIMCSLGLSKTIQETIRKQFAKKSQIKQIKAVNKKAGFVYYNQSFLNEQNYKYA